MNEIAEKMNPRYDNISVTLCVCRCACEYVRERTCVCADRWPLFSNCWCVAQAAG